LAKTRQMSLLRLTLRAAPKLLASRLANMALKLGTISLTSF
jgi:hypothetical protein